MSNFCRGTANLSNDLKGIAEAFNMTNIKNLWRFKSQLSVEYEVIKITHLFSKDWHEIFTGRTHQDSARRLIIIDKKIDALYGDEIRTFFDNAGIKTYFLLIECIEKNKNIHTIIHILQQMDDIRLLRRSEPIFAIGGGILLDIVGLAASLYRRGVPYIRIPTTLVGLVDAAIGVKTGINCFQQRNRIGTYYPPIASLIDSSFLKTLPTNEIKNGLSEILKLAIVTDKTLFDLLYGHGLALLANKFQNINIADKIIERSIMQMAKQLYPNLWEQNLCRLVDFGHSFSPLIEMESHKNEIPLSHGEAVIIDVYLSCLISNNRGILSDKEFIKISTLIDKLGLNKYHPLFLDLKYLQKALDEIIVHRNGLQNLPLPTRIGSAEFYNDIQANDLEQAIKRTQLKKRVSIK